MTSVVEIYSHKFASYLIRSNTQIFSSTNVFRNSVLKQDIRFKRFISCEINFVISTDDIGFKLSKFFAETLAINSTSYGNSNDMFIMLVNETTFGVQLTTKFERVNSQLYFIVQGLEFDGYMYMYENCLNTVYTRVPLQTEIVGTSEGNHCFKNFRQKHVIIVDHTAGYNQLISKCIGSSRRLFENGNNRNFCPIYDLYLRLSEKYNFTPLFYTNEQYILQEMHIKARTVVQNIYRTSYIPYFGDTYILRLSADKIHLVYCLSNKNLISIMDSLSLLRPLDFWAWILIMISFFILPVVYNQIRLSNTQHNITNSFGRSYNLLTSLIHMLTIFFRQGLEVRLNTRFYITYSGFIFGLIYRKAFWKVQLQRNSLTCR